MWSNCRSWITSIFIGVLVAGAANYAFAQSKVNITTTLPSSIDVCGTSEIIELDVRNITTGSLSGVDLQLDLPQGLSYVLGSLSGNGVSEKTVSNLQKPIFSLPQLGVASSATLKVSLVADCDILSYMSNGGIPRVKAVGIYSGGSTTHSSLPLTINQPVVNITGITNQFYNGSLGEVFVRTYTIKNDGKGALKRFYVAQSIQSGIKRISTTGGVTKGDTTVFDSVSFISVGNKDRYLSPGESVTIVDTLQIVKCNQLGSSLKLNWGCNGKICSTTSYNTQVSLKTVAPALSVTPSSKLNACFDANTPVQNGLVVVNTGDDSARNALISIFQSASSGFYGSELSSMDTSSLRLRRGKSGSAKRVNIVKTRLNLTSGILSCLGNNPIASMDLDIGVLLPGDTIYLDWESNSCCVSSCFTSFYAHRWKFTTECFDQCNTKISQTEKWGSTGYYHGLAMTSYGQTDIVDKDTAKFLFTVTTGRLLANSSNSILDIYVELPGGLKHSLNKSDLEFRTHTGQTWTPNSVKMVGDSVHAQFKGRVPISLVNADLVLNLIGDCSNLSVNKAVNFNLNVNYTPDATCSNACVFRNFCYTGSIKVHCDKQCSSGLRFSDFSVERISYGLADNDNNGLPDATGSLDIDNIRTERATYGDTVQTVFRGKINALGSVTTWKHLTASSYIPYGKYLAVADARIRIFRGGKQLYSCNDIGSNYATVGNHRTFEFDLGVSALISAKCPLYSGFSYTTKDSIEFIVKYTVAENPGNFLSEIELTNSFYLHTRTNPPANQRYQCDSFSGKFVLLGSYFTNCCRGVYSSKGCDELVVSQNYYLSVGRCCSNYAGGNIFPREYRKWARADILYVIPPVGFDITRVRVYDYRTAGTGGRAYRFIDSVKQTGQRGDTLEFDISSYFDDQGGAFEASDDGFYGVCYYTLRPNCEARKGYSNIYYGYRLKELGFMGNGYQTVFNPVHRDEILYEPPDVTITTLSDDVSADSDTAVWQVKITNASSTAGSENVWLSYEDNGNTRIESVIDVSTGKPVQVDKEIFQLGDLSSLKSKSYLIRAVYTSCDRDSFKLYLGHDCRDYPDSLANAACIGIEKTLYYTPKNTLLTPEVSLSDTIIDLCSDVYFDVTVKNLGSARAFDLSLDLFLPEGFVVADSAWVYLTALNDSFLVSNPTNLGAGKYRWDISSNSSYLKTEGLKGVTAGGVNEYTIRFPYTTNCDFVSSTYFLVRPGGKLRCGDAVLSNYAASRPVDITGIVKPYFSYVEFEKEPVNVCNYNGDNQIAFLNLGPDTTGVNDYVQLILPKGVYVDTNYLVKRHNAPTSGAKIENTSRYVASWKIPSGIQPGDSVVFDYRTFVVPSELSCGPTQIYLQSVVSQPALCVRDSSICLIDVSTSSDLQLDSIIKGDYFINVTSAQSTATSKGELIQLSYRISNTGALKDSGIVFPVKIVADTNGNGIQDVGEETVYADTLIQQIDRNWISRTISFETTSFNTCNLLFVVDSTNCVCSPTYQPVGRIHLVNAGRDTISCSDVDISIGSPSMPGAQYKWLNPTWIADADSSNTFFNAKNTTSDKKDYRLILETDRGDCKSYDTTWITLYPAIIMDLTDTIDICSGDRVLIGEVPSGGEGFKTYQWSPTDSLSNPNGVKPFANPSKSTLYSISIIDDAGCSIEDSTMVMVRQTPSAKISFYDTCVNVGYDIRNTTTLGEIGLDSFAFVFDNGTTVINLNPGFTPKVDSVVGLSLFVRDSFGCTSNDTIDLTPFPLPVNDFTVSGNCQFDTVFALNTSTIKSGTISSKWYIENDTINANNLVHFVQRVGDVEVKIINTSDKGCTSIKRDTVNIAQKPTILVTANNVCQNLTSTFNTNASVAMSLYQWDWNDGNTATSLGDTSHIYGNYGDYNVRVTGESVRGCLDTFDFVYSVHPIPVASFISSDACKGDTAILTDNSNISQGEIVDYYWNDGTGYTLGDSICRFSKATFGLYPVQHIVVSDSNCADTSQVTNVYFQYTENPRFDLSQNCSHQTLVFTTDPSQSDSITSYDWSIDGVSETGRVINHSGFNTPGEKEAILSWAFVNGCTVTDTQTFMINGTPQASFNWSTPCDDNLVDMVSSSTNRSTGSLTHSWMLGDGNSASGDSVRHQYAATGSYDVMYITSSQENCSDTVSQTIAVNQIVQPDFDIRNICVYDSQWVKETSIGRVLPISTSTWQMGDGYTIQNRDSFEYAFQNPGNYTVSLSFETNPGCDYSTSKPITVHALPTAGFAMNPERADVVNSEVDFSSMAIDADSTHYWISTGFETKQTDFTYRFPDTATYTVTQTVVNQYGCIDQFTDQITIDFVVNILIPNAFSPNLDEYNPTFSPQGLGIGNFNMKVFNRWGEQVFQTTTGEAWTGENALPGAYFYLITILDYEGLPHHFNGIVHLIR